MMYNDKIEDCFFHPRHVGCIPIEEPHTVHFGISQQGLVINLYMQCTDNKIIKRFCFKTNGNPYVIACLEWLCRQVEGLSLGKLPEINHQVLINALAIPTVNYPVAIQVDMVFKEIIKRIKK